MAVSYVKELFEGRRASDSQERRRTYTRVYEVRTTDPNDSGYVAGGASGLPRGGDAHPDDNAAFVVRNDPAQHSEDPTLWTVTIEYDTQLSSTAIGRESQQVDSSGETTTNPDSPSEGGQRQENPLSRPPVYSVSFETVQEPLLEVYTGEDATLPGPLLNSAGDPFDPPPMVEKSYPVLTIKKNMVSFTYATLEMYQDSVNSVTWRGFGARKVKVHGISWESAFENGITFWAVTFVFKVRYKTWDLQILDAGLNELIPAETDRPARKRPIVQSRGETPTSPLLLDGSGRLLAAGDDPVILRVRHYPELPFADLGV